MSKFNTAVATPTKTVNKAGGEAYVESPELALVSLLLTSFLKDQFYRKGAEQLAELEALLGRVSPLFAAKAAIYARQEFGMRSITHALAGELSLRVHGEPWMKRFIERVVRRPDDMLEILAYVKGKEGKMSHALEKGLALAFAKFSAYELAKYKGDGKAFKLVDLANLVHPANSEQIAALVKGTLAPAETWETGLTQAGQKADSEEQKQEFKADAWRNLIGERKIGYFALLRNLRNIMEQAPDMVDAACEMLVDERLIKKSLVLPFRFTTAMEQIEQSNAAGARKVVVAISKALDIALANVPHLEGKTLIAVDHSGSMQGKPIQIASLFAAVLYKTQDADLMLFHDSAMWMTANPNDSASSIAAAIIKATESRGTNFHCIFQGTTKPYARIIILSDMQAWMQAADGRYNTGGNPARSFADYKTRTGANPHVYSWDLQGLGTLQFPEQNVYALAGFSEKVFDIMALLEQDRRALIHKIETVEI